MMLQIAASLMIVIYDCNMLIIQATGLAHKHFTRMERPARDKHSRLLVPFVIFMAPGYPNTVFY